jgi:predicted O-methyltransferase YrrM
MITYISKQLAISQSLTCKGWTNKRKLGLLYDLSRKIQDLDGDILEIGSAWGRSTILLGKASHKMIWSIDPHTGGLAYINQGQNQDSFNEFKNNITKHGLVNRVHILKLKTHEVMDQQIVPEHTRFAMIFIDGLHTAEGVQIDFDFSFGYLLSKGIMIFDDYFEPSVQDYTDRINELISKHKLYLIKNPDVGLCWYQKP